MKYINSIKKDTSIPIVSSLKNINSIIKDYEIKEEWSNEAEEGYVVSQSPEFIDGYKVNVTEKVTLVISKGQKLVTLPKKMIGKNFDDIAKELDDLEIQYEKLEETSETVEEVIVISVEPEYGEET